MPPGNDAAIELGHGGGGRLSQQLLQELLLPAFGPADGVPMPPLNRVGDFGGGGMLLAFGMVCGLLEAQRSGKGQVVDAAMVDGAALLLVSHDREVLGAFETTASLRTLNSASGQGGVR
jgi:alpha-methylacyl-CoA racemase